MKKFSFWNLILMIFGFWGLGLFLHFGIIVSNSAWLAIMKDATRAFSIVTRWQEVLLVGTIALGLAIIVTVLKAVFQKKENEKQKE